MSMDVEIGNLENATTSRLAALRRYKQIQEEVVVCLRQRRAPTRQLLRAADEAAAELAQADAVVTRLLGHRPPAMLG